MPVIIGDENNNSIDGTAAKDRISGLGGDDELYGNANDDRLFGGTGNDFLYGGDGFNLLYGEDGNDQLNSGGAGRLFGGEGNDYLVGGGACFGQAGDDKLTGYIGSDHLSGGSGKDYIYGADGADLIFGGAGADFIDDSAGLDTVDGGAGRDTIGLFFFSSNTPLDFTFAPIDGAMTTPNGSTVINIEAVNVTGGNAGDTLSGGSSWDTVRGWQGNDLLHGGAGNDFMIGDNGEDTIYGDNGNDTLLGGGHGDTLDGGAGDDLLIGGKLFDLFSGPNLLIGGAGADTIEGGGGTTTLSFETSPEAVYVDFVRGRGFGGDAQGDVYRVSGIVYLSNFDDVAIGGGELFGLGGDDTLVQYAGTRLLTGGAGADMFELNFNFDVIFEQLVLADFDRAAGDKIDLSDIDARPIAGDQAFTFIGTADFTDITGQVRYRIEGADTIVELQIRGDANPDHTYVLTGVHALVAEDFQL